MQSQSQAGQFEGGFGPSGGCRLARAPDRITLLDVVEMVEGRGSGFARTEIRRNNPCLRAGRAWREALRAVRPSDLAGSLRRGLPQDRQDCAADWLAARG